MCAYLKRNNLTRESSRREILRETRFCRVYFHSRRRYKINNRNRTLRHPRLIQHLFKRSFNFVCVCYSVTVMQRSRTVEACKINAYKTNGGLVASFNKSPRDIDAFATLRNIETRARRE